MTTISKPAGVEIANRINLAIKSLGPVPIPNYTGLHWYNEARPTTNGDWFQLRKSRTWYSITLNDGRWLLAKLEEKGF